MAERTWKSDSSVPEEQYTLEPLDGDHSVTVQPPDEHDGQYGWEVINYETDEIVNGVADTLEEAQEAAEEWYNSAS